MCEDCICNGCEKFGCCYCDCCSCSKKCCGCTFCTTCSICGSLFLLYFTIGLIIAFTSKNDNYDNYDNYTEEDPDICHSIEFKPKYIDCNSNNVLYIDLSLAEDERNSFHFYRISLYKYFDIKAVYNKSPFLLSSLEGSVFSNSNYTVSFPVEQGQYSLEFKDNLCGEEFYNNIEVPPYQSSCESEDQIFEQEIRIPINSFIPEFVIIMDISGSMRDVIHNYIKIIIPEVLSNLNYQTKSVTLITFSGYSNVYNYTIEQFKLSNIQSAGTTLVSEAFKNLKSYLSKFSKKNSLRILTISDGQIFDKDNAIIILNDIYSTYYGQFPINSRCVRVGNVEPDTKIFLNILRLIYPSTPTEILSVTKTEQNSEIIRKITKMFENDGIGNILWITSEIKNIRENPYSDYTDEVPFINDGRKFVILKKMDNINTLYVKDIYGNILKTIEVKNNERNDDVSISPGFNDYSKSLVQKYIYNKINNSSQAILENEKIKKFFEETEANSSEKKFSSKINEIDNTDLSRFSDEKLKDFINQILKIERK